MGRKGVGPGQGCIGGRGGAEALKGKIKKRLDKWHLIGLKSQRL